MRSANALSPSIVEDLSENDVLSLPLRLAIVPFMQLKEPAFQAVRGRVDHVVDGQIEYPGDFGRGGHGDGDFVLSIEYFVQHRRIDAVLAGDLGLFHVFLLWGFGRDSLQFTQDFAPCQEISLRKEQNYAIAGISRGC